MAKANNLPGSISAEPMYGQLVRAAVQTKPANYGRGNIDLNNRPTIRNKDGSFSTVDSTSFNVDGKEVLIPTVINDRGQWKHVDPDTALKHYQKTGEHLGKFNTPAEANAYARKLHMDQAKQYGLG